MPRLSVDNDGGPVTLDEQLSSSLGEVRQIDPDLARLAREWRLQPPPEAQHLDCQQAVPGLAVAKTQYLVAASIDGFIADADNSLAWLFEAEARAGKAAQAAREERFRHFFAATGAMTMGAATYEWVVEHEDLLVNPARWREYYDQVPCWVFTHRKLPTVPGANVTFVSGEVRSVYDQMMAAAQGRNLWVVGGGEIAGQFADLGLLDEIIVSVAPVTLGAGSPLLPRRLTAAQLTLTDCSLDGTFASFTYLLA